MSEYGPCPLWDGGTLLPNRAGFDGVEIESRRAGGRYRMSGSALRLFQGQRTSELAAKLTTWIIDQHRSGNDSPLITSNVLEAVRNRSRLAISQQIQRFFLLLLHRRVRANDFLTHSGHANEQYERDTADLSAWMECETSDERSAIIRLLHWDHLVDSSGVTITLTPTGVRRLEEIQRSSNESRQAFVAMWFDPSMDDAYDEGFSKAIEDTGYTPLRIDRKEHNNKIDDEIVSEIRRSRFVVADFTSGTVEYSGSLLSLPRGGVYFEAGFAMGLGIPVIWSCRKDQIDKVHFDTRQFSHITWETPDELRKLLYNRISAVIHSPTAGI